MGAASLAHPPPAPSFSPLTVARRQPDRGRAVGHRGRGGGARVGARRQLHHERGRRQARHRGARGKRGGRGSRPIGLAGSGGRRGRGWAGQRPARPPVRARLPPAGAGDHQRRRDGARRALGRGQHRAPLRRRDREWLASARAARAPPAPLATRRLRAAPGRRCARRSAAHRGRAAAARRGDRAPPRSPLAPAPARLPWTPCSSTACCPTWAWAWAWGWRRGGAARGRPGAGAPSGRPRPAPARRGRRCVIGAGGGRASHPATRWA